jgi:TonB family protein
MMALGGSMFRQALSSVMRALTSAGDAWLVPRRFDNPRFYASSAVVILLHGAAIWLLATAIVMPRGAPASGTEFQVALVAAGAPTPAKMDPVPEPPMLAAASSAIAAPNIEIQAAPSPGAWGPSPANILPPRPDPKFQNVGPALPAAFPKTQVQILLTILVDADGAVTDARVAQSSGQSALDQLAEAFVKAKWRFRAALLQGKPVADWTTVLVRFAPVG